MRVWAKLPIELLKDEDGAALIEYTVLIAILLVAVIAVIITVGGWVSTRWTTLNTGLSST
jgi:pilus assembly protein Flp/PilA